MSTTNVSNFDIIFEPVSLGGLRVPNRIVMAPMTRRQSPGGIPDREVARYYAKRAEGGVGFIITEGTYVDHPVAGGFADVPHCFGQQALDGWRRVVEGVHDAGSAIAAQLWHLGNVRRRGTPPHPELPSIGPERIVEDGVVAVEKMTDADARDIAASFARAACDAVETGFDAIELHGAHGYLFDQFLWAKMNTRADAYGGSLENRLRLSTEVAAAVRKAVGASVPIIFRFSQWKVQDYTAHIVESSGELQTMLDALVAAGVDIFDVSTRRFWEPAFPSESDADLASLVRKLSGKPVIMVGSVGIDNAFSAAQVRGAEGLSVGVENLDRAVARIEAGSADCIALGRALLADPAWPAKVRAGEYDRIVPYRKDMFSTLT
ncbi:12-oxophytodienoate reductase [Burkholderia oklahomensis]|uniref:Flavin oxidoreductase / NADH oxidase family protein n=1 Tax=Burkholderia oklahomensis TaxID=342113 RepID=A0AAI8FP60_9BURK|nr:12-oxophytodienoate reductase [Burkholderia oklahomensis]AIO67590.1 flavin oxidoreductase / NADH oxidase family protein [Burkholderia oklahomensis]AOI42392.1 12-oxophytodienoate reductase [Burkholderia oklahomensis EO147]KUY52682.1 12-oxophytodienoate reductase [Burkholderia oklahomensis EO147]QPS37125.1 12-oxophytodienoate reductase [Burkholderia oklahomensis]